MALYSAFIGVHEHRDLNVRDLTGARRDATTLWALFFGAEGRFPASLQALVNEKYEQFRGYLKRVACLR